MLLRTQAKRGQWLVIEWAYQFWIRVYRFMDEKWLQIKLNVEFLDHHYSFCIKKDIQETSYKNININVFVKFECGVF